MKTSMLLVAILALTGCGRIDRGMANFTGKGSEVCQGGVLYLQFTSGVSVAYTPAGLIKTCKG